jgi:4-hydroxybenzoyl-CoA thioesterase
MIFTRRYPFRFGDIDHAGIGYYPKLLHYFHCCFEDWWAEGLGAPYPAVMREENLGMPTVHLEVDYYAPVRYGDTPDIHLAVLRIGNSSVEFGFWMTHPGQDRPLCRARVVTAAVAMDSMQGRPLPDKWRQQFERYRIAPEQFPARR